ncbi:MAG: 3-methyl-2-oxobutanoate hydroxymethyltransferase [Bdellovibrio sp.]
MKKRSTRDLRNAKKAKTGHNLSMLTCYDFQTASMMNQTDLDMILVGDSLGNVILGYETTVEVSLEEMKIFSAAVKRGASQKFVIADLPFGTYSTFEDGVKNALELFQKSKVEAIKLEGAYPHQLDIIRRLVLSGVPVVGHIGLTPQSVHELGGYYTHGKNDADAERLMKEAILLEEAGVFCLVLECVNAPVAEEITNKLKIPTIGIGSGNKTDGQVLVINDLLQMGPTAPPKFCKPIANLFEQKKQLIETYLKNLQIDETLSVDH